MHLFLLLPFILFTARPAPLTYGFSSGILDLSETAQTRAVVVPHYNNPTILYSLTSVSINGFFSYFSNYTLLQSNDKDTLTISVQVGGTYTFNLAVSYVYMESMPNLQVTFFNLTYEKPLRVFNSKKGLAFDEDTYVSAHLVGFSSSNNTKDNFFYAVKFNITYSVYTNTRLRQDDWIAINFVILQSNYDENSTICIGSYINSQSEVTSARSPLKIQIQPQLNFILGLEAIHMGNAQFMFNKSANQITMKNSGTYSFSIIVINNTCNYVFDYQLYEQTKQEKMYLGLMITFISLFIVLGVAMTIYFLKKKWRRDSQKKAVEAEGRRTERSSDRRSSNRSQHKKQSNRGKPNKVRKSENSLNRSKLKDQQNNQNKSARLQSQEQIEPIDIDLRDEAPGTDVRLKIQTNLASCPRCQIKHRGQVCNACNSPQE